MSRHPIIGATLAMLVYACALSAAEWQPEREANGAIADEGRLCAALAIFYEGRGEGWDGQAAIAQVVVNRAKASGSDLCTIVLAPGQFIGVPEQPPRHPWTVDPIAWATALDVADAVINGTYTLTPPACAAATSFHRAGPHEAGCVIGAHVFTAKE